MTYRHLDYEVLLSSTLHNQAGRWCAEHFGPRWEVIGYRSGRWAMFWAGRAQSDLYRFCFAQERDMILFMLKWSTE